MPPLLVGLFFEAIFTRDMFTYGEIERLKEQVVSTKSEIKKLKSAIRTFFLTFLSIACNFEKRKSQE